ncbi:MAG: type I glyceraldehyde-3-phosphate dehydrogenase [Oceanicoccus sp.]|uniref:type I glyceraldehyde-3-phosphate dehydrogenase n=1 Tax=Oceanicoccus sp. TaxID=2691044 RepID=UPI00260E21D5|nr:type I glyceraldehyde-3-phosphate dehydrogenase [Oceanicoccus sp.]MCP3906751.1 type I glyceraldehyde-3-phosphate dehydrogenase [Oceanicoccus sp.]MDG1772470.1 type I glyceraldehyde-3-phosphate dehydrogenase [Oceanicoccus sp.]
MKRIAINGLGREGRSILRQYAQSSFDHLEIVAANDILSADNMAYLLQYDSAFGHYPHPVSVSGDTLSIADKTLALFHEENPQKIPWMDLDIDMVIECTGRFADREAAFGHIAAGARRVLIAAPAYDADIMLVMGVNEYDFDPEQHKIISSASCTTHSLAPALKLLQDNFGIEHAMVTTIHAYTATQSMVDTGRKKMMRGRAGAVNIIPTTTGAEKATTMVLPELAGLLTALAVRVPVVDGSLTDVSVKLATQVTVPEVNHCFRTASSGDLNRIIGYTDQPLVSSDIIADPHSCIVHGLSTRVVAGSAVKLQLWYDNEYAYARRCLELVDLLPLH